MRRVCLILLTTLLYSVVTSCGGSGSSSTTNSASPAPTTARRTPAPTPAPSIDPSPTPSRAPETPATPAPTTHPGPPAQPLGFPLDPSTRLGLVTGNPGSRIIEWGAGPDALTYTRDLQPSGDPDAGNGSGWNCAVHVEYEGRPAADWYIPIGTPIYATMSGTATLYAVTLANGFDWYGVDREPYLGNPDRSRASIYPFPGPSGGLGVYVEIDSGEFLAISAHLELSRTAEALPADAFYQGYSAGSDWAGLFGAMPASRGGTAIAQWQVARGDLIGYSGDTGYSEAPHLHYTIQYAGSDTLLCPTTEPGFPDGGWLLN